MTHGASIFASFALFAAPSMSNGSCGISVELKRWIDAVLVPALIKGFLDAGEAPTRIAPPPPTEIQSACEGARGPEE
jgi:hypothetical protein